MRVYLSTGDLRGWKRTVGAPGAGAIGCFEALQVGAGTWTRVLCKNGKCS